MPDTLDFQQDVPADSSVEAPAFDFQADTQIFDFQKDVSAAPPSETPETDKALNQSREAQRPKVDLSGHPVIAGIVEGIGRMIPKSLSDVKQMATLPMPAADVEKNQQESEQLGAAWRGEYGPKEQAASITGTALQALPLVHLPFAESPLRATPRDLAIIEQLKKGEADASTIPSTTSVPEPEVRPQVGEEAPLRQQGEATGAQAEPVPPSESVATETPTTDAPVESVGANVKGFAKIYGEDAIPPGEVLSPEEEFTAAQERAASGKVDPYSFVDRARTGAITPSEMGDLIVEHDRLINEAAAAEGTPQYDELYNRARTFAANVVKPAETAWARQGRTMQIKAPIDYSRLTGFRRAVQERFGREMLPEEQKAATKMSSEVDAAKKDAGRSVSEGFGNAIKRFKNVPDISFEDSVKQIHESINEEISKLKPCP